MNMDIVNPFVPNEEILNLRREDFLAILCDYKVICSTFNVKPITASIAAITHSQKIVVGLDLD